MLMRTIGARVTAVLAVLVLGAVAAAQDRPNITWAPASASNYSRGRSARIDTVVIHTIEGSAQGAISWFRNPRSQVSAHYVVSYSGRIFQCVRDSDTAWHVRSWNSRALGIEHEGYAGRNNWTDAEYRASARLTAWLCRIHRIPVDRQHIRGHVEIPGNTHTDPGRFFNWTYYMQLVRNGGRQNAPSNMTAREVTPETAVVRDGASWGGRVIGTVRQNQIYVANAEQGGWRRIFYSDRNGWVWDGSLRRRANGVGRRFDSTTTARDSRGGSSVGRVDRGEVFIANQRENGWLRIWYAGRNAWVPESATRILYFP